MVLAVFLLLLGLPMAGYGLHIALSRKRPVDLAGVLLSIAGLLLAILGAARMLSPRLFG
jgi:hypothetical protein